jgi:hypothetical protein
MTGLICIGFGGWCMAMIAALALNRAAGRLDVHKQPKPLYARENDAYGIDPEFGPGYMIP